MPVIAVGITSLLMSLAACGGADLQSATQVDDVAILPVSPLLAPGETVKFSTVVDGKPIGGAVKWSVEQADGGTIDAQGNYTAPATEGTYTVDATASDLKTTRTQVSVVKGVHVSVSPSTATVATGGTLTFTAGVSGKSKGVTWSVLEGSAGGTITSAGVYTAPDTSGTYHVVATSTADPTVTAQAVVTVTQSAPTPPPPTVSISVTPSTASIVAGTTVQLTATVSGSTDTSVTWSVTEQGGGSVSSAGLYTAPATAGTYHVVATSHADPTQTATSTISVTAQPAPTPSPVTVSLQPTTASVAAGGTVQLTATVSGATDTSVTWSVTEQGGGTVSSAGLYTAPATAGTYHVVATSNADKTQSATATITVTSAPSTTPTGVGTGVTHTPQYITNVTGGGAMPDISSAPVASCPGDGKTDATSCLQNAINSAAAAHKPLLIPATSASYEISNRLQVTTSLIGINGMPTIHTTNLNTNLLGDVLEVESNFSGWIYNLHLVGNFNGTGDASGQWAHTIDLGCASNVTISGNFLEKAIGDAVSTDHCHNTGGQANNVLIANNTMKGMFRCGVAFIWYINGVVVRDNLIDKQSNFVSGIDFEPEANGTVSNVEVLYNEFAMYNTVPYYAWEGSDGKAVSGWQVSSNPGGNYYIHDNYGHYGTGFGGQFGGSNWGYIYESNNVAGPMP